MLAYYNILVPGLLPFKRANFGWILGRAQTDCSVLQISTHNRGQNCYNKIYQNHY